MKKHFQSKNPLKKVVDKSFSMKEGKQKACKLAAGGAAKVRLKEATPDGKPMKPRRLVKHK